MLGEDIEASMTREFGSDGMVRQLETSNSVIGIALDAPRADKRQRARCGMSRRTLRVPDERTPNERLFASSRNTYFACKLINQTNGTAGRIMQFKHDNMVKVPLGMHPRRVVVG